MFSLAAIGFHVIAASVRFDGAIAGTRTCPLAARADPAARTQALKSVANRGPRRFLTDHRAASRPSVVWLGGIRMPTIASSGRCSRTSSMRAEALPAWPRDLEAGAVEHAGQTFAQEDVVGREHYLGGACGHTDH